MNSAALLQKDSTLPVGVVRSERMDANGVRLILERVLNQAEKDERNLAYDTSSESEQERKKSGSYYTPVDVATFFWNQFFDASGVSNSEQAIEFVRKYRLIEPSCGSGVLVYALLYKLIDLGVPLDVMRDLDLHMVDLNASAINYAKRQFTFINAAFGVELFVPSFTHMDFLKYSDITSGRPVIVFGNPPFVANSKDATWKNTYADFMVRCLENVFPLAAIHFILPLSIAFSRDYSDLRNRLRSGHFAVYASHFDNIPDTLFKSGKPQSDNTNKANSQRCSIISAFANTEYRLFSSPLHRWSTSERSTLLGGRADFHDVTRYYLNDQFIRPATGAMALYLQTEHFSYRLGELLDDLGDHTLYIGGVARNYISVRGEAASGVQAFSFRDRESFYRFLGIISSDVFLEYWRSVGDGFHVTRANVVDFPVSDKLSVLVNASDRKIKSMWARRHLYKKTKLNSGKVVHSYDFLAAAPKFIEALPQISANEKNRNEEQ